MTPARIAAARRRHQEGESARSFGPAVKGLAAGVVFWLTILAGYWLAIQ